MLGLVRVRLKQTPIHWGNSPQPNRALEHTATPPIVQTDKPQEVKARQADPVEFLHHLKANLHGLFTGRSPVEPNNSNRFYRLKWHPDLPYIIAFHEPTSAQPVPAGLGLCAEDSLEL